MARKKAPAKKPAPKRTRSNKGKTSSKPGESAKAHEFLMSTLEEGGDPYGDKAWLDGKRTPHKSLAQEEAEERARIAAAADAILDESEAPAVHKPPPKIGRPTEYKDAYVKQAEKLCRLGATDVELADFFEVDVRTIYRWMQKHEAFCQAVKTGKAELDERIERSLYHRAVGYTHKAVKIFMPAGAKAPVYAEYDEHVPPETTACIFWLKNRRPEQWRDKREIDVNTDGIAALLDEARQREAATQSRYAN